MLQNPVHNVRKTTAITSRARTWFRKITVQEHCVRVIKRKKKTGELSTT